LEIEFLGMTPTEKRSMRLRSRCRDVLKAGLSTLAGQARRVAGMRVELQLKVEPAPTLVDFGAADTVYGVLRDRERMILEAGDGMPQQTACVSALACGGRAAGREAGRQPFAIMRVTDSYAARLLKNAE
jgi:hypothetical protein